MDHYGYTPDFVINSVKDLRNQEEVQPKLNSV